MSLVLPLTCTRYPATSRELRTAPRPPDPATASAASSARCTRSSRMGAAWLAAVAASCTLVRTTATRRRLTSAMWTVLVPVPIQSVNEISQNTMQVPYSLLKATSYNSQFM